MSYLGEVAAVRVLPIHMGVILKKEMPFVLIFSTPHTHGGDSYTYQKDRQTNEYFPIHMGVILLSWDLSKALEGTPYTWGKLLVNCQWLNKIVEKGRFKNA